MQNKLLLLHGALGSSEQFKGLEDYFPGFELFMQTYPVMDLWLGKEQISTTLQFSNYLFDYVVKNNLKGAKVFAFSMGGYVSLYTQAIQTELFSKILTLATKFNWNPEMLKMR